MPATVRCECGKRYDVSGGAGQTFACQACGNTLAVPVEADAAPGLKLPPYERAVIDKLDAICHGTDAIGRRVGWALVLLGLILLSSCGGAAYLVRH